MKPITKKEIEKHKPAPGNTIKGPEPYACYNTGFAPSLTRGKNFSLWAVGYEDDIRAVGKDIIRDHRAGLKVTVYRNRGRKVWVYRQWPAARDRFAKLTNERIAEINTERAQHQELKRKAAGGDLAAALALNDY